MTRDDRSVLMDRYEGATFGCFLAAAAYPYPYAQQGFDFYRDRSQAFVDEMGYPFQLPSTHQQFIDARQEVFKRACELTQRTSDQLGTFCLLGMSLFASVADAASEPQAVADVRAHLAEILRVRGLDPGLVDRFWERGFKPDDELYVDDLVGAVNWFINETISSLDVCPDTAFVALPFSPPFVERFRILYRPLLSAVGFRSFRAWGGIASEDYWSLLVTLIRKSRLFFAEMTGLNPNVMHEIGLAEGMDKKVLLVAEDRQFEPPSNLGHHPILNYFPDDTNEWSSLVVEVAVRRFGPGLRRP